MGGDSSHPPSIHPMLLPRLSYQVMQRTFFDSAPARCTAKCRAGGLGRQGVDMLDSPTQPRCYSERVDCKAYTKLTARVLNVIGEPSMPGQQAGYLWTITTTGSRTAALALTL